MIKYAIPILLGFAVIILGLSSPFQILGGPRRDPVPSDQKVAHSIHCTGCHGKDETGQALVDGSGHDVSIYDDWHISMMGLSAHDPFWRATLAHEVSQFPSQQVALETTCLKCHAPLGSIQAHFSGLPYSYELMLSDSLGLDGVSCSSCHQQPSTGLGSGHTGNIRIDTNRVMFGQYPNPFKGPMQIYVGFEPVFSDHIYSSGVCAGCHTLITETLEDDGTPSGQYFIEQATYHEWLNSVYPAQGKECQTCHLPFIRDSVVIATDFLSLQKRHPFGLHQFFGANTAMLSMMKTHKNELGIAPGSSDEAWDESIKNNRVSLSKAGVIEMTSLQIANDTLYVDLTIKNKSGHKLPSGYPSRIAWIQIALTAMPSNDTIYSNGMMDSEGNITGRDLPYEPHHQISTSSGEVQIYEMVMSDLQGHLTTSLNAAAVPFKDNRLLPIGFRRTHVVYDTTAIWGDALMDAQYDAESQMGQDKIQYRIPLNGRKGIADLDVTFRYHTFPSRWMQDLFNHDSIPQVGLFKSLYQGYEQYDEVIDHIQLDAIDLSTSSSYNPSLTTQLELFPNPGNGHEVYIQSYNQIIHSIDYQLMDINGRIIHSGTSNNKVELPEKIKPGLYYFIFSDNSRLLCVKPYVVL